MFYRFRRMIMKRFHVKNSFYRVVAYCIVAFLMLQCYGMSRASEEDVYLEDIATIFDATSTSVVNQTQEVEDLYVESVAEEAGMVGSATSDLYRVDPDISNGFVAYAMTTERGAGIYTDNQCAVYVANVLFNYYGEKAPVENYTLVSQISNALNTSENWECVYADTTCLPTGKTEAEFDAIFDSFTNAGDIVCFVNGTEYVHCAIAGGGNALIGHLYSSGWDSLRACYYIDNAVDTRKACSGMIVYRYKEPELPGTIRICKNYDENIYRWNPQAYDIGGACYAIYLSQSDAQQGMNAQGYCYIEPGVDGAIAENNISGVARTQPNGEGDVVEFEPGTVYVKEYSVPIGNGWELDTGIYETEIVAGKQTVFGQPRDQYANELVVSSPDDYYDTNILGPEKPNFGKLGIQKGVRDCYASMINGNSNYDFSGVEYFVYKVDGDQEINVSNPVGSFTMDAEGNGTVSSCAICSDCVGQAYICLPYGWYMVQETKTNESMTLDTTPRWVYLSHEKEDILIEKVYDSPWFARASLMLRKFGVEGEAVMGAVYEVCYYKQTMQTDPALQGIVPDRIWRFQTDERGEIRFSDDSVWFVSGNELYRDSDNQIVIPAGTLTFREETSPDGYKLDETVYVKTIEPGDEQFLSVENAVTVIEERIPEPVIRTKAWYDESKLDLNNAEQTIRVTDTVTCQNLIPGHTYIICGEPHKKDDGSVLMQGGTAIYGYTQFTADKEVMLVDVYFDIVVTKELYGSQLVFFETLYEKQNQEKVLAEHKDLEDEDQTIEIPEPDVPTSDAKATPTEPERATTESETVTTEKQTTPTETEEVTTEQDTTASSVVNEEINVEEIETVVKTGDNSWTFVAILISCTAATGLFVLGINRKKQKMKG